MRRNQYLFALPTILTLCLLAPTVALAQTDQAKRLLNYAAHMQTPDAAPSEEDKEEEARAPASLITPPDLEDLADEETRTAYLESLRAYYGYKKTALDERARVYEWQLLSSKIIFVVVIALVLAGMYFSWLQFTSERRKPRARHKPLTREAPNTDIKQDAEVSSGATRLKAALDGIEVSSPVLGVTILAISVAFFYMYLRFVYPITESF